VKLTLVSSSRTSGPDDDTSCRLVAHRCEPAVRRKPAAEDSLRSPKPPSSLLSSDFRALRFGFSPVERAVGASTVTVPSLRRGSRNRLFRKARGSWNSSAPETSCEADGKRFAAMRRRQIFHFVSFGKKNFPTAEDRWECAIFGSEISEPPFFAKGVPEWMKTKDTL